MQCLYNHRIIIISTLIVVVDYKNICLDICMYVQQAQAQNCRSINDSRQIPWQSLTNDVTCETRTIFHFHYKYQKHLPDKINQDMPIMIFFQDENCYKIHWSSVLLSLVSYILLAITLLLCLSCFARVLIQWSVRSSLAELRGSANRYEPCP